MSTTTERYRTAGEAGDLAGVLATLAEDVVLHSPLTTRVRFEGKAEVRAVLTVALRELKGLRYRSDVGDERTRVLVHTATVGGQELEETARVELNSEGLISSITLSVRPLPGLTALMAAFAGPIARELGKPRWVVLALTLASKPLALLTRVGDRQLVPLATPDRG
ncbi:nuclear transport factor 2 family protein [Crossiella sp. SN42]|uniref:nuclear transport factor 2 family protein n=1 Tax=Crossiella sp. SN42 TaxID=2944808 RepID=UPI00207C9E3E|nr:nuclear transport factor 2 family protein [Crossiella sp. SN42]MCO1582485.1 nuclear transport factor 2 family protein [Crossiella sp. SN42]